MLLLVCATVSSTFIGAPVVNGFSCMVLQVDVIALSTFMSDEEVLEG